MKRGPVVYCFEEADLPTGVELDGVGIDPTASPCDDGPHAELGGVPTVRVRAVAHDLQGWPERIYCDSDSTPATATSTPTQLRAVPYFTWANRRAGAMRVWTPASQ